LYLILGRYPEALELFSEEPLWRAITLARSRRVEEARAIRFGTADLAYVSLYHAALGDTDRAFDVLEQARAAQSIALTSLASPLWDPMRGDKRFAAVAKQIGLGAALEALHARSREVR
jgi:hypothetical protein